MHKSPNSMFYSFVFAEMTWLSRVSKKLLRRVTKTVEKKRQNRVSIERAIVKANLILFSHVVNESRSTICLKAHNAGNALIPTSYFWSAGGAVGAIGSGTLFFIAGIVLK
jgi:hypothetical protein